MNLVPFERFATESALPPQELSRRLAAQIDPPRSFRWPWDPSNAPFEGRMEGGHFFVWALLKFRRDAFRPVAVGSVHPLRGGSVIRGVIRLRWGVMVLVAAWIAISLSLGLRSAAQHLRAGRLDPEPLLPVLFAMVGYLFCMVPFWLGGRRIKRVLVDVARP